MDSLRIRQAAPEDAAALGRLLDQLGYPTNAAEIPKRLENVHERPGTTVLVADQGDFPELNELYTEFFPSEPPARMTMQVPLPRGLLISIGCTAVAED